MRDARIGIFSNQLEAVPWAVSRSYVAMRRFFPKRCLACLDDPDPAPMPATSQSGQKSSVSIGSVSRRVLSAFRRQGARGLGDPKSWRIGRGSEIAAYIYIYIYIGELAYDRPDATCARCPQAPFRVN